MEIRYYTEFFFFRSLTLNTFIIRLLNLVVESAPSSKRNTLGSAATTKDVAMKKKRRRQARAHSTSLVLTVVGANPTKGAIYERTASTGSTLQQVKFY